jgi:predicted nucleic acid-binding protein
MNEKYVIDAYAWIEYLIGSRADEKVKSVLEEEGNEIFTCAVTIAGVVSKTAREGPLKLPMTYLLAILRV